MPEAYCHVLSFELTERWEKEGCLQFIEEQGEYFFSFDGEFLSLLGLRFVKEVPRWLKEKKNSGLFLGLEEGKEEMCTDLDICVRVAYGLSNIDGREEDFF